MSKIINGVNVTGLSRITDEVKADTTLAKFRFRVQNEWLEGGHNRSTLSEIYGAGQLHHHATPFVIHADEPIVLLGNDQAPNPVEYLLAALASCVTSSLVYHAAARGIKIEEVESQVEGDIDVRGFLGLDPGVRNGFQNIRLSLAINADVTDEQLKELAGLGTGFSPVFDSVTKGVPVAVRTERMKTEQAADAA
ncbi:MAG TPA: OsmC family protein [Acidobacteriaceae bacterium]|nr:OsmC family protein [Acidobacteriaceae bacterium]